MDSLTTADFNAELHARPSIYFSGPALVEHISLMPLVPVIKQLEDPISSGRVDPDHIKTRVEHHTEFVTVTRVTMLDEEAEQWPEATLLLSDVLEMLGLTGGKVICQVSVLVMGPAPEELGALLSKFEFVDTAASVIGSGSGQVCSDFRVQPSGWSRILMFNKDLNAYRLGRMVRRVYEIETYRSMALLGLPEARRLGPMLQTFDAKLVELSNRNLTTSNSLHKELLEEISQLSAQVISAKAETRNRFGGTAAYAKIVEERISELRETHVPGFQRFGIFVARRFKPAVRTCEATTVRLDNLASATTHLLDLLQTRIQVEIEFQNAVQIQVMAERAATQVRIQRAVEGFSIIAISYYLLSLLKMAIETAEHLGVHVNPFIMLVSIPLILATIGLAVLRVKKAIGGT